MGELHQGLLGSSCERLRWAYLLRTSFRLNRAPQPPNPSPRRRTGCAWACGECWRRHRRRIATQRLPDAERVRDLFGRMTLEEKFWQLFMIPGDLDDSIARLLARRRSVCRSRRRPRRLRRSRPPGAAARRHAERINAIQRYFVERTRLGIPIIPFEEALHGFVREGGTVFPQAIALAATWDTALMARVAGRDRARDAARGIRQVLSPVVNIANDVRWGRVEETYGEDPYLTSVMGARVRRAVRARRRRRDAETLRRERRRRRARQLSDRGQRADARGAVLSAVRGGDPRARARAR